MDDKLHLAVRIAEEVVGPWSNDCHVRLHSALSTPEQQVFQVIDCERRTCGMVTVFLDDREPRVRSLVFRPEDERIEAC